MYSENEKYKHINFCLYHGTETVTAIGNLCWNQCLHLASSAMTGTNIVVNYRAV